MHYFKFNIGDYHKKAGRLTMLEHGAYTLLLHACYDREKFPTKAEAIDWCWARSVDEIAAVEFVLSKFFKLEGDVYVQDRIQEEIDAFHAKSEKNKHIALEREAARRTKRARSVDESSPEQHESPPNHKPQTKNQVEEPNGSVDKVDRLPACDYDAVVALYHELLPELPSVRVMSDSRKRAIQARWRWVLTSKRPDGTRRAETAQDAFAWLRQFFELARDNDFIMGRGWRDPKHSNWQADIDYLLSERGLKQVVEKTRGAE